MGINVMDVLDWVVAIIVDAIALVAVSSSVSNFAFVDDSVIVEV